jgi:hypothetical protein
MKYAIDMGSGAMTYISGFIKIGSGIRKLIVGYTVRHTTARLSHKSIFIFSK